MINKLDSGFGVSEFELQLRYYDYFPTNELGKDLKAFILSSYKLNGNTVVLLQRWL